VAATFLRFKTRWIREEEKRNHVKSLLTEACQAQHSEGHIVNPVEQNDFVVCLKMRICVILQRQKSWSRLLEVFRIR